MNIATELKPCLLWTKAKSHNGYGLRKHKGKMVKAHRFSYCDAAGIGLDEIKGQLVLHSCDTPACIEPTHLRLGSNKDNSVDMVQRDRECSGVLHRSNRLTETQVIEIFESTKTLHELAAIYSITFGMAGHIKQKRKWKKVIDKHLNS